MMQIPIQPSPPSGRSFPTMRQVIHAALIGIASHPRIQKPGIFLPLLPGQSQPEEALIQSYRAYGGYELTEPGLVCSVYPSFTTHLTKGSPPSFTKHHSVELKPYTLGPSSNAHANYEAVYHLVVELTYQAVAIGDTATLSYDLLEPITPYSGFESPHGLHFNEQEDPLSNPLLNPQRDPTVDSINAPENPLGTQRTHRTLTIEVNPGEELLREYMDLLRLVLDDLPTMRPYTIRSSTVRAIDYPTSTWTHASTDVFFHSAFLLWELSLFPPAGWRDIYFLPPTNIALNANGSQYANVDLQTLKPPSV